MDQFLISLKKLYTTAQVQPVSQNVIMQDEKRAQSQFEMSWVSGRATYPEINYTTFAREGYGGNIIAYACISFIARSASEVPFKVVSVSSRNREYSVSRRHLLVQLLENPNPDMTFSDFIATTFGYLNIAGNCYWEKERSAVGRVVALWPMQPDRVRPIPGTDGRVSGYAYTHGDKTVIIPAANVLHFKYFHPLNAYEGLSPMQVAARRIDVDTASTDSVRAFFDNKTVPAALLIVKKKLLLNEAERIKADWKARFTRNYHDVAVIDQDMDFKVVGQNYRDTQLDQIDLASEARICAVFGVPPILVGLRVGLENSPWSNISEARRIFWEDILIPQLNWLSQKLTSSLAVEFDDTLKITLDTSNVIALREDRAALHAAARDGLNAGYLTINDARQMVRLPPVRNGDIFMWRLDTQPTALTDITSRVNTPGQAKADILEFINSLEGSHA